MSLQLYVNEVNNERIDVLHCIAVFLFNYFCVTHLNLICPQIFASYYYNCFILILIYYKILVFRNNIVTNACNEKQFVYLCVIIINILQ